MFKLNGSVSMGVIGSIWKMDWETLSPKRQGQQNGPLEMVGINSYKLCLFLDCSYGIFMVMLIYDWVCHGYKFESNLLKIAQLRSKNKRTLVRGANSSWNCLPRGMRKMRNHFFYSSGNEETGNKLISFPGEWGIHLSSSRIPKIPQNF